MSDKPSAETGTGGGAFQAAQDAVASVAEQVRATAPGAYEAGAKTARYIGETTSEHPISVLLATAALAFLAGYASHTQGRDDRRSWERQAQDWRRRGYELNDRVRSAAPTVSQAATEAGEYVAQNVRDHPFTGVLIAGSVFGLLGYLLGNRD